MLPRLKRLLTLLVAYACACVAGGLVLASPLLSWMLAIAWDTDALVVIGMYSGLVGAFALLPSLIAIRFGERRGIARLSTHVLLGTGIGLAGLLLLLLLFIASPGEQPLEALQDSRLGGMLLFFLPLSLIAGACAGLVYWFVAWRLPAKGWLWPRLSATAGAA